MRRQVRRSAHRCRRSQWLRAPCLAGVLQSGLGGRNARARGGCRDGGGDVSVPLGSDVDLVHNEKAQQTNDNEARNEEWGCSRNG